MAGPAETVEWQHRAVRIRGGVLEASRTWAHDDWDFSIGDPSGPFALTVGAVGSSGRILRIVPITNDVLLIYASDGRFALVVGNDGQRVIAIE